MEIKKRLRQLRQERHETQKTVAAAIGVTEQHYQTFEYGKHLTSLEKFCDLADHFGVSLDYLAFRSDQR